MTDTPNLVILGAGMAGLATAYHLAVNHNIPKITIVDERAPLGLTSSRGTMAYRNWFPGPGNSLVRFINRSIELLEQIDDQTAHAIQLSRGGYVYLTATESQIEPWREAARDAQQRGIGEFREHQSIATYIPSPPQGWWNVPDGVDLITNPDVIRQLYPDITPDVKAMLHIRRCGAFDAIALGRWLLQRAADCGAKFLQDRVDRITVRSNRIQSIHLASSAELSTNTLVIAAGPLLPQVAQMLDLDLPVYNELHGKLTLRDSERVFPRYGDLIYWSDPQTLPWNTAERATFAASDDTRWLLDEFPSGVHFLPKGTNDAPEIMALWTYDTHPATYVEPPTFEPHYAEIVLRGLARVVPATRVYFNRAYEARVDGGYYCKTRENRPLIGPLPIQGAYLCGALSGYGVMASQAAGELISAHITGTSLPDYAPTFLLSRYDDPTYQALLANWDARSGQL
ncbi:MAG TPA: FAD-dependent oxidoreductase [Anaerolineae bacterium]|nr:FAD-dependent oxidoreductase [Anaerolineae bacterium]